LKFYITNINQSYEYEPVSIQLTTHSYWQCCFDGIYTCFEVC